MKCPVAESSRIIGKKWAIPLLEEIAYGKFLGFNKFLAKSKGLGPAILAMKIKELEKARLIKKLGPDHNNKMAAKYELTEKGMELYNLIVEIKKWNIKWNNAPDLCIQKPCTECPDYQAI